MRALVFSIDDAYVMPFKVLWHSLMQTESVIPGTPIFILHEDTLSPESIRALKAYITNDRMSITFLDAQRLVPDDVPLSHHISKATYYRLYIASILPISISSVVYLDSDAVAVRSVRELFELELVAPLAAADHLTPSNAFRLWGEKSGNYFQAGVLVIDLDMWRCGGYEYIFSKILREQSDRIMWWDQDVLNIAFENKWQRLPIWFNVCGQVRKEISHDMIVSETRFLHLDGSGKPWKSDIDQYHALEWYRAYALCFGAPFDRGALQRPFFRRLGSSVKRIMKYTAQQLRSV